MDIFLLKVQLHLIIIKCKYQNQLRKLYSQ